MSINKVFGLKTGTVFTAKNKLGETRRYRFQGIDLSELEDGCVGCRYIVLQNMDDKTDCFGVEAAWFAQREITIEGEDPEPIKPRTCNGYTVVESTTVAGTEIVICKPVPGNKECTSPYVVWQSNQIGSLCYGEQFGSLEVAQWNLHEKAIQVVRPIARAKYREQQKGGK